MGMLFNTEQTTKMLALVNRNFAADAGGGGFAYWAAQTGDVDPRGSRKTLSQIVNQNGINPDPADDNKFNRIKGRWHKWLRQLEKTQLTASADPTLPTGFSWPTGSAHIGVYTSPFTNITVAMELCRQVFNGLSDPNCIEMSFSLVPSTAISLGASTTFLWTSVSKYSYLITINTMRVDDF